MGFLNIYGEMIVRVHPDAVRRYTADVRVSLLASECDRTEMIAVFFIRAKLYRRRRRSSHQLVKCFLCVYVETCGGRTEAAVVLRLEKVPPSGVW